MKCYRFKDGPSLKIVLKCYVDFSPDLVHLEMLDKGCRKIYVKVQKEVFSTTIYQCVEHDPALESKRIFT